MTIGSSKGVAPDTADLSILIIGSGFSGLGMGIALRSAGIESFVILEKANSVGGTWRENHYPGCACDVQSHLYSFSFEPNPDWTRMFAPQTEIQSYLHRCTEKYGLMAHILFGAEVAGAHYDEAARLWTVTTTDGRQIRARILISGMGGLSTPAIPDLPGLSGFSGKAFHSAEWRHDYDLKGKRVAVIGTGASAIQFVPQIQKRVAQLDLYQRTAPWIMPKPDRPIGRLERWFYRSIPQLQRCYRSAIYWLLEIRVLGFIIHPRLMKLAERKARAHLNDQVRDHALRAKLTPSFTFGCKRVLISNDYYPSLVQPNCAVIPQPIREVRAKSIVTDDGIERPVDCIIYGTGFKAQDPLPRGLIHGRNGVDLLDAWAQGPEAFKGTTVTGFPNLFLLVGPNVGLGHSSMVYMIESQVAYILDAIRQMQQNRWRTVEVRTECQQGYNQRLQNRLKDAIWSSGGCKSWYLSNEGKNTALWPGFTFEFRHELRRFEVSDYEVEV